MVVGDRNMENARNGRRSRGPSPNGHLSDDSGATDESEQENVMRVGSPYQAKIPDYNPNLKPDNRMEAMLVWAPHPELPEVKVDEYTQLAKEKHGYNMEQALGMLFWHKHNIDMALADLANFTPFPDEWTVEDKVLFEQAFSFHGKSFHRIRQMLPDKAISQLVKYYYSWKKTRSRTSLMDRQARKLASQRGEDSDEEMGGSGNSDSDFENGAPSAPAKENGHEPVGEVKNNQKPGPKSSQSLKHGGRNKRKPPRGMHLNYEDLVAIATGPPGQGDHILTALDAESVALKRQVQNNKQIISLHKAKTQAGIDKVRPPEAPLRINSRWTNEELLLAVQGVRKYGKDFEAIAEVIGNKQESHARSFFVTYRRRFNLDEVLAEYEAEYGKQENAEEDEKLVTITESDFHIHCLKSVCRLCGHLLVGSSNHGRAIPLQKVIRLVYEMEVDSKASDDSNGSAAAGNGSTASTSAPPPLLKQGAGPVPAPSKPSISQPLHVAQQSQSQPPRGNSGRPILQQPPPLIRPSNPPKPQVTTG